MRRTLMVFEAASKIRTICPESLCHLLGNWVVLAEAVEAEAFRNGLFSSLEEKLVWSLHPSIREATKEKPAPYFICAELELCKEGSYIPNDSWHLSTIRGGYLEVQATAPNIIIHQDENCYTEYRLTTERAAYKIVDTLLRNSR